MRHHQYLPLCQLIKDAGGEPFIVGGYVRDMLLDRNPKDVDIVVVGLRLEEMDSLMHKLGGTQVGAHFPVYLIDGAEVALARRERKVGVGHTGFECEVENVTLREDLERRDLTMNAMAMDPFTGTVRDPFNGIGDIKMGLLNAVGPHFKEDPLRVLRAARFAAQLDMCASIHLVEVAKELREELPTISPERVWGELLKALRSPKPSVFFEHLDEFEVLDVLFPEIANLQGRIQPEKYHPEGDAYVHTLQVIDRARDMGADDETMFAALVHDLGKAVTPDDNLPHHYNHEALGVPLVNEMCDRLRIPNTHRRVGAAAAKEHLNIHRFDQLKAVKKVRLLFRLNAIHDDVLARRVVMASKADARGRGPMFADEPYDQGDRLLKAAAVLRTVNGSQFTHLRDGNIISQKMEQARTKALKEAGF